MWHSNHLVVALQEELLILGRLVVRLLSHRHVKAYDVEQTVVEFRCLVLLCEFRAQLD